MNQNELLKDWLLKKGKLDEIDINIALRLKDAITNLDQLIFGDAEISIRLVTKRHSRGFFVQYCHSKRNPEECYEIFIPGLAEFVDKNFKLFKESEKGIELVKQEGLKATSEETIFSWAAHEVRHRIQFHYASRMEFFTSDSSDKSKDPLVNSVVYFVVRRLYHTSQIMANKGEPREFIDVRTGPLELDAQIIELLVLHRFSRCCTKDELRKLVLLEAER